MPGSVQEVARDGTLNTAVQPQRRSNLWLVIKLISAAHFEQMLGQSLPKAPLRQLFCDFVINC